MIVIKSECGLKAKISEVGAQLCSLSDSENEYIYNNEQVWKRHAPVLFPFVGRLPDGEYYYNGKPYKMNSHGFAPTAMFKVENQTENSVKLKLVRTDEIFNSYPFDFEFYAQYKLEGKTLTETFTVENTGNKTLYYGFGSHPGFNVPISKNLKFEDYYIEFPEGKDIKQRLFDEACLDSGKEVPFELIKECKLNLKHSLFDNDAILLTNTGSRAVIKTDKDSHKIIVDYPDTPFCALWHKVKMEVPFVCIEPWVSIPGHKGINEITEKKDFVQLPCGGTKEHILKITILE